MKPDGQEPPDVERLLSRLKGFQRDAVEYAFHRLYEAPDSTKRFLVADEVGLGKTLIARGIVAKAVAHLWESVERIDVVYICSNAAIARQNVRRLAMAPDELVAGLDRITMLPVTLSDLASNRLNFVAVTPGTSFDMGNRLGKADERRLLYWLMQGVWPVAGTAAKNLWQGNVTKRRRWRSSLEEFRAHNEISDALAAQFHRSLRQEDAALRAEGRPGLEQRYLELCDRFGYYKQRLPPRDAQDRAALVSELRALLARACVRALEPDLVILDEFQRFRHLLQEGDEAGLLARELFRWQGEGSREHEQARVLLLSATPYKMYTLAHEAAEDDHHSDFLKTIEFLEGDAARTRELRADLAAFRRELYALGDGGGERLVEIKGSIEARLRRVMSRTERTGAGGARDGMLREVPMPGVRLEEGDVRSFTQLAHLARELGQPQIIEYWKSAPYLLELMEGYQLKRALEDQLLDPGRQGELARLLCAAREALLPWDGFERYEELPARNARLRGLLDDVLGADAWRCLWIPPSLPYHRLEEPFAATAARGFTKRLVFSGWQVVPRALSTLVSYEVERRAFRAEGEEARNDAAARKRRRPLLRFSFSGGRLVGMPVLGLLYPSSTLAELGDPLCTPRVRATAERGAPPLAGVLREIEERLAAALTALLEEHAGDGPEDEAWYWAAPILLDAARDGERTRAWFERDDLAERWSSTPDDEPRGEPDDGEGEERWSDHVARAALLLRGELELGAPPADLGAVLALQALAGPAVSCLRALARVAAPSSEEDVDHAPPAPDPRLLHDPALRDAAARVAWSFRTLFNRPESTAIVRGLAAAGIASEETAESPFWRQLLSYCAGGCLTAVLDEHAHLLRDLLGLFDHAPAELAEVLADELQTALSLRTSTTELHEVAANPEAGTCELRPRRLRSHFAMRFGRAKSEDGAAAQRGDLVRTAFNSPFWPFILATTSIGQEGLDFHAWCHAVVHWNLPSNPVDLEQREGRVHRYKGHAVRRSVASAHASEILTSPAADPWTALFARARRAAPSTCGGLVPHWIHAGANGIAIERLLPSLPLTRDRARLPLLRRSLALYRLVFGQPRQDDLLEHLMDRANEHDGVLLPQELLVDLAPRSSRSQNGPQVGTPCLPRARGQ